MDSKTGFFEVNEDEIQVKKAKLYRERPQRRASHREQASETKRTAGGGGDIRAKDAQTTAT